MFDPRFPGMGLAHSLLLLAAIVFTFGTQRKTRIAVLLIIALAIGLSRL